MQTGSCGESQIPRVNTLITVKHGLVFVIYHEHPWQLIAVNF